MPQRSDKAQADGAEYKATQRARNGSPQFMHGHIYLRRGWDVRCDSLVLCGMRCLHRRHKCKVALLSVTLSSGFRICCAANTKTDACVTC